MVVPPCVRLRHAEAKGHDVNIYEVRVVTCILLCVVDARDSTSPSPALVPSPAARLA
jgi:hypothetical protein